MLPSVECKVEQKWGVSLVVWTQDEDEGREVAVVLPGLSLISMYMRDVSLFVCSNLWLYQCLTDLPCVELALTVLIVPHDKGRFRNLGAPSCMLNVENRTLTNFFFLQLAKTIERFVASLSAKKIATTCPILRSWDIFKKRYLN